MRAFLVLKNFSMQILKLLGILLNNFVILIFFEPVIQGLLDNTVSFAELMSFLTSFVPDVAGHIELSLFVVLIFGNCAENLVEVTHIHARELQVQLVLQINHEFLGMLCGVNFDCLITLR